MNLWVIPWLAQERGVFQEGIQIISNPWTSKSFCTWGVWFFTNYVTPIFLLRYAAYVQFLSVSLSLSTISFTFLTFNLVLVSSVLIWFDSLNPGPPIRNFITLCFMVFSWHPKFHNHKDISRSAGSNSPNSTWWWAEITNFLITQISPVFRHFFTLGL